VIVNSFFSSYRWHSFRLTISWLGTSPEDELECPQKITISSTLKKDKAWQNPESNGEIADSSIQEIETFAACAPCAFLPLRIQ
jgi:hypothetical protein